MSAEQLYMKYLDARASAWQVWDALNKVRAEQGNTKTVNRAYRAAVARTEIAFTAYRDAVNEDR